MGNFEIFRTFDGYDGLNKAYFCVPLCYGGRFYFYASPTSCSIVVEVLTGKFLDLWRACRYNHHKDIADGDISTWKLDSNLNANREHYERAALRESAQILAEVGFSWEKQLEVMRFPKILGVITDDIPFWVQQPTVSFTNGVTRTLWLLIHHAPYFPVQVFSEKEALDLVRFAGTSSKAWSRV